METIGDRIKELRKINNLTLQEVAEVLSTSKGNISNYENNVFKPSADSVIELSRLFNVSTDYILTGASNTIKNKPDSDIRYNFTKEEQYIINLYRQLNERNKIKLEGYLEGEIIRQKETINKNELSTLQKSIQIKQKKDSVTK